MISIVDSSVAIKWYTPEADSEPAKRLLRQSLAAPDLIRAEVANALWRKVIARELLPQQAKLSLSHLTNAVTLLPSEPFTEMAFDLAVELSHPIYDCLFLVIARTLDFPLVTADKRLWRCCRKTALENRVTMLADRQGDI